jgi:homoserine dehydrogenase
MSGARVIVLKFGGSVLRDPSSLPGVVHEIHRWRRDGWQPLAVVSAFAGETDRRLACAHAAVPEPDPHAVAALLAGGEGESAARLGLALDAAGIASRVLPPAALRFLADGDPVDAEPRALDVTPIRDALAADAVPVVPGFLAVDREGRTVTLGRGGSDLTAFVLAHALAARVRLVKDVDGLYERDPAAAGPRPRRWDTAHWDAALATDGTIVPHKATCWARRHGVPFELGAEACDGATRIGPLRTRARAIAEPPPLRVTLLGVGTVGGGVLDAMLALPARFQVVAAARRRVDEPAPAGLADGRYVPLDEALAREVDVVVELMGGTGDAHAAVNHALRAGRVVVTANKALLAAHGPGLRRLARASGARLLDSAAVGGALPLLERLRHVAGDDVRAMEAVLNGTTNWVLDRVRRGASWADAVQAAIAAGLAEAEPTRDLSGRDAADKLCVIAQHLGWVLAPEDVELGSAAAEAACVDDASSGNVRRQVARLWREGASARARVRIEALPLSHALADVAGEWNGVVIEDRAGRHTSWRGRGAGRRPTTESVLGDLLELWRGRAVVRAIDRDLRRAGFSPAAAGAQA